MELFLNEIHMPSVNDEERKKTGEITVDEINTAIHRMAPEKSPGIDGLQFYSKFHHKLTPLYDWLTIVRFSQKSAFSTFSNTASIILPPKIDKDPLL